MPWDEETEEDLGELRPNTVTPALNEAYGVAKMLLIRHGQLLAEEFGGKVLVNSYCPGGISTDMTSNAPGSVRMNLPLLVMSRLCSPQAMLPLL